MRLTATPGRGPDTPKYRTLIQSLSEEIEAGKFRPGQKFPSEADLVKRFSVSRITAGRAVRELARSGLVERRAGSGTYVRTTARSEPETGAQAFGLLIPDFRQTEIFDPITRGMAGAREAERFPLLWGRTLREANGRREQSLALCRDYIRRRLRGVFFAPLDLSPASQEVNLQILEELDRAEIPVVLLDRSAMPYPQRTRHDLVGIDNHRVGFLVAEHLLGLGSRRLVFLAREHAASTVDARIAGFREALWARGIAPEMRAVQRLGGIDRAAIETLMAVEKPDGLVCANDRIAAEAMHHLLGLGYRIPQDVKLAGIDDVEYASLLPVPLTTVRQPCREIGETAMATMVSRISEPALLPRDILLESELVIRESCGGIPSGVSQSHISL